MQILDIAASYIGTHEEPPGSNNVFCNTDYYGHPVSGESYPWCCTFVWDIFRMANLSYLFYNGQRTAYCPTVYTWAVANNMKVSFDAAQPGDLVLFDWDADGIADHIGFVERLAGNVLVTIEGNTSDADYSNGGYVLRRERNRFCVLAIVHIDYPCEEYMFEVSQIQKGDSGKDVYLMQALLRGRGYRDKLLKKAVVVDSQFGDSSERALMWYQEKNKLTVDGICGAETWRSLLRR